MPKMQSKRFRPQFTISEMEALLAALHHCLENVCAPEYHTPQGAAIPAMHLAATAKKLYVYKQKAELGLNAPSYVVTGEKPGRKTAADIIREEAGEVYAQQNSLTQNAPIEGNSHEEINTGANSTPGFPYTQKDKPSPKEHNLFMYNRYASSYGSSITSAMSGDSPMSEDDIYAALTHKLEAGETLEEEEKRLFNKVQMQQFMSPE